MRQFDSLISLLDVELDDVANGDGLIWYATARDDRGNEIGGSGGTSYRVESGVGDCSIRKLLEDR